MESQGSQVPSIERRGKVWSGPFHLVWHGTAEEGADLSAQREVAICTGCSAFQGDAATKHFDEHLQGLDHCQHTLLATCADHLSFRGRQMNPGLEEDADAGCVDRRHNLFGKLKPIYPSSRRRMSMLLNT
ncbi:hypothetical protein PIIN_04524 [Serendipita indica DSM 11827]|uniref:Uncharacterized protein n=1 Tax=Serendipita indica (strain DSM 11827) TaxID=1109443 RepID=G4TGZ3_SERID|nr:hypothetical protein PIIN_04524 [Serendipita indica DSM 11827]